MWNTTYHFSLYCFLSNLSNILGLFSLVKAFASLSCSLRTLTIKEFGNEDLGVTLSLALKIFRWMICYGRKMRLHNFSLVCQTLMNCHCDFILSQRDT